MCKAEFALNFQCVCAAPLRKHGLVPHHQINELCPSCPRGVNASWTPWGKGGHSFYLVDCLFRLRCYCQPSDGMPKLIMDYSDTEWGFKRGFPYWLQGLKEDHASVCAVGWKNKRLRIVKVVVLFKLKGKFSKIPIQKGSLSCLFAEIKLFFKLRMEMQGNQNSQNRLEKEEQSWKTHTSWFQNLITKQ